jgi:hypothetical protein
MSLFTPEQRAEMALASIKRILADDVNYQTAVLKLGGIWSWCDSVGEYECGTAEDRGAPVKTVRVKLRDQFKT